MESVDPIRDTKKISQIKNVLRGQKRWRDLLLFVVGINTALRVSDLLKLRIGDFVDTDGAIYDNFRIREEKRNKTNTLTINDSIKGVLAEYLAAYPTIINNPEHYLFFNTRSNDFNEPIKRGQAWSMISEICHDVGLRGNFGTHSLRKTWGYQARMSGVELPIIMHKFKHSSLDYTKRYIGITDDEIAEISRNLNL